MYAFAKHFPEHARRHAASLPYDLTSIGWVLSDGTLVRKTLPRYAERVCPIGILLTAVEPVPGVVYDAPEPGDAAYVMQRLGLTADQKAVLGSIRKFVAAFDAGKLVGPDLHRALGV
jgi:hypothetical protein